MERRAFKHACEVREGPNGPMIVGYAAVFNSNSEDLGGFIEQVDPGAFSKTLAEADVISTGNHDDGWLLGRSKTGTLRLQTDPNGLRYEVDINPQDPDGQRALAKVKRGDWDGSSFEFMTVSDQWNWDSRPAQRRLLEVKLRQVGPVTVPAYPETSAAARALERIAAKLGHPVEKMVAALRSGEIRSLVDQHPAGEVEERATWDTAYINDLPDSAFLYIEPGGKKDSDGKTTPRALRHFPYKDASGAIDLPHLRNALARIPQSNLPADVKDSLTVKATKILDAQNQKNELQQDYEERQGKMLSAASVAAIQKAIEQLEALIDAATGTPDDEPAESNSLPLSAASAMVQIRERELATLRAVA